MAQAKSVGTIFLKPSEKGDAPGLFRKTGADIVIPQTGEIFKPATKTFGRSRVFGALTPQDVIRIAIQEKQIAEQGARARAFEKARRDLERARKEAVAREVARKSLARKSLEQALIKARVAKSKSAKVRAGEEFLRAQQSARLEREGKVSEGERKFRRVVSEARVPALEQKELQRQLVRSEQVRIERKIEESASPTNIFSRKAWRELGEALRESKLQKDRKLGQKILTEPLSFVSEFVRRALEIEDLPAGLLALIKNPANIKQVPRGIIDDIKGTIQLVKTSPSAGLGRIGADIFTFRIIGGSLKVTGQVTKTGATKLFPKRLGVKVSPLGVQTIKKVRKVGQIEIIPPTSAKITVKPKVAVKVAKLPKQLKKVPKLAPTTNIEKRILKVVKKRGDAVTGSFAQESLLKKQFARRHKDIDILTKNPKLLANAIKKELGNRVKIRTKLITDSQFGKFKIYRVFDSRTGKLIADLDPIKFAEQGFVRKFGFQKVGGIKLVSQKARLASKVRQLGKERVGKITPKGKKVTKDIELLFGKRVDLNSPTIKGAFGFTQKELRKIIGQKGPLTTAQQDLFKSLRAQLKGPKSFRADEIVKAQFDLVKRQIFTPKELKLQRWLYATPADPKTGIARVRVSRLGLSSGQEASLRDLLRGQASFKKGKSAIYVFTDEKIFKSPGKLTKGVTKPTPQGFVVPLFSSELDIVLGKGWIIKKGKRLATRIIDGEKVSIIELKKIRIPKTIKSDLNKLGTLNKKVSAKGFKKTSKAGKELVKRIDVQEKAVNVKLKKVTGFDYFSKPPKGRKVFPIKRRITTRAIKRVPRVSRKPISRITRRKPISRIPSRPSAPSRRRPSRAILRKPISRVPSRPSRPTKPISKKKISRGISRPSRKVSEPTRKKIVKVARAQKVRVTKKPTKPVPVFNVFGKSGKKFVRLNVKPLTKDDALSRGTFAVDRTTSRQFQILPAGKSKKPGTLRKGERNYFKRQGFKLREFKIRKGRKFALKDRYIERIAHSIDTKSEKAGLSIAKFIKQKGIRKPRRIIPVPRKKPIKRITPKRKLSQAQLSALTKGRAKLKKLRKK